MCSEQYGRGQVFLQGRHAAFYSVEALMQTESAQIQGNLGQVFFHVNIDANVGVFRINGWAISGFGAKLIGDSVFNAKGRIVGMEGIGVIRRKIHGDFLSGTHVVIPLYLFVNVDIKIIRCFGFKTDQGKKDAVCETGPETDFVCGLKVAFEKDA